MGWFGGESKSKQSKLALEKMQHKITLNEQTQKNTYDLTNCEMYEVPVGTHSMEKLRLILLKLGHFETFSGEHQHFRVLK